MKPLYSVRCEVPVPRPATKEEIAQALHAVNARLDALNEEILRLAEHAPDDPGITRWPPDLARDYERVLDEQDAAVQQAKVLARMLREMGL